MWVLKVLKFWKALSQLKVIFSVNQSFESRNKIVSFISYKMCKLVYKIVSFIFRGVLLIWGLKLNLTFKLILINIRTSFDRVRFPTVSVGFDDDFSPKRGICWIFKGPEVSLVFLNIDLIYYNFHEFRAKRTSDSYFDDRIEFKTLNLVA